MRHVLDSSAVLAMYWGEPGSRRVAEVLNDSIVSSVNAAEIVAKFMDRGANRAQAREAFEELGVKVVSFAESDAVSSGLLRSATRASGLSLGDRACLALAIARKLPVMTADRAWSGLDLGVEIEVIR